MGSELRPGTLVGRYRLLKRIARGGMGTVWVARDVRLERDVAVKVLPRMLVSDPSAQRRFEREARAMARLSHANVVSVLDVGTADPGTGEELPFLVMELIRGRSLDLEFKDGPMDPIRTISLIRQVARALGAAHSAGVIHRDLKPSNIMVDQQDNIIVLDFGLARLGQREGGSPEESLTTPGMVLGSCPYMAPEQALGQEVLPASDIFSCGSVMYEALGGQRAFEGETPMHVLQAVVKCQFRPLEEIEPYTPPELLAVVERCLKREPAKRYADGDQLADDLSRLAADVSTTATRTPTVRLGPSPVKAVREKQRRRLAQWTAVSLALLVGGAVGGMLLGRLDKESLRPDPGAWSVRELLRSPGVLNDPAWDSAGERLITVWSPPGRAQVLVVDATTGERRVVADAEAGETFVWPSFSPDDRAVVMSVLIGGGQSLRIVPATGGPVVHEITNAIHGTWMERQKVVFSRSEEPAAGLWLSDLESLSETRVLPGEAGRGWWTAAARPRGGVALLGGNIDVRSGLYVGRDLEPPFEEWLAPGRSVSGFSWAPSGRSLLAAVDGALVQLSSDGPRQLLPTLQSLRDPVISPDGKSIAVVRRDHGVDLIAVDPDGGSWSCLNCNVPGSYWGSVAADGVVAYRLISLGQGSLYLRDGDDEARLSQVGEDSSCPSFSPDGIRIAYLAASEESGTELRVVSRTGGDAVTLATGVEAREYPSWSPDGRSLTYAAGEPLSVWVVSALGGTPRLLTPQGGDYPYWSPDGKWIAYVVWTDESDPLQGAWVVPAEGGEPRKIGDQPTRLVWSNENGRLWQLRREGNLIELWQCTVGEWRWRKRSTLDVGGAPASHFEFLPLTVHPVTGELVMNRSTVESALMILEGLDPARW
ncbi:MAG: protein kinase [bacterium]|nr:protein kinase [bacterium]